MRLRNIPRANDVIAASHLVIREPKEKRGQWQRVFGNDHPIHIEVGMGKGRFITDLAKRHPEINYIGIERYTSVLLRAVERLQGKEQPGDDAEQREDAGHDIPENLYFICMDATELPEVFAPEEVARIYLNFSDPWPKDRHAKRRLPSRQFLARYDQILDRHGIIEFKTDNRRLFDFALEEIEPAGWRLLMHTFDLYADAQQMKDNIMTEYEEKFTLKGNPICKMIIDREVTKTDLCRCSRQ